MKRWMNILMRGGTLLISISLALFLVSFLPPQHLGNGSGVTAVPAGTFSPLNQMPPFSGPLTSYYERTVTPQQGMKLELSSNGTITAYILEVDTMTLFNQSEQYMHAPDLNITALDEFLDAHPDAIGWQHEVGNAPVEYTYIPTKITNMTVIYANPSSEKVTVSHSYTLNSFLAPSDKVRNIAFCAAPIGIVLLMPWLLDFWTQRKHK
jgi:hypothetical protein